MDYSYYPGCSLHSTGLEYDLSTRAVFRQLQSGLKELQGWNCCGASSAHALNHSLALALPARTIALAQPAGLDLVTPCAACFNRLKSTDYLLRNDLEKRNELEAIVDFKFQGKINVRPVMAVLYEDYGLEKLGEQVKKSLNGLRVVPYYGCLLVRPPMITQFDDPHQPYVMAELLKVIGAEVKAWAHTTDCCGAGLSLSRADIVRKLVGKLVQRAREAGAEAMVTACPLCQVNLEMRQVDKPGLPTFYITELLGLAFGAQDSDKWWNKHLIDPTPLLHARSLI